MRPVTFFLSQSLAAVVAISTAMAQSDIPTVSIDAYTVGKAPASVSQDSSSAPQDDGELQSNTEAATEGQSTLNGTLYAVIAPTFDGSNVTSSFFRFVNGGASTSQFSVSVVGSPSGDVYGTALIDVPTRASPQYSLAGIRDLAGAGALANGDTSFALYVQNADTATGYQHVIFNNDNGFFENASICKDSYDQALATVANSKVLINVHTSQLAPWPSQVEIHNFWNAPVTYTVSIIESASGTVMGQVNIDTEANASYSMPFTFFESQIGWTPASGENHANVVISDPVGAAPNVVLGHSILNEALSANLNMSTICAVNEVSEGSMGGGFGDGGFSY